MMHFDTLKPFRVEPVTEDGSYPRAYSVHTHYQQYHPEKVIQLVRVREFRSHSVSPPKTLPKRYSRSPPKAAPRKSQQQQQIAYECEQQLKNVYTSDPMYLLVYNHIEPLTVQLPMVIGKGDKNRVTATTTVIAFKKVHHNEFPFKYTNRSILLFLLQKNHRHTSPKDIAPVSSTYYRFQENLLIEESSSRKGTPTMPAGEIEKPTIVDNRDGTISLKYDPKSEGNYEMQIKVRYK